MVFAPFEKLTQGCAVVVGGSGGLGQAIVRRFAEVGSNVALSYRNNRDTADALCAEIEGMGVQGLCQRVDVADVRSIESLVNAAEAKFGTIHTLVFATGPAIRMSAIADLPPAEWAAAVNADVMGFFNVAHASIPALRRSRGSIVALSTAGTKRYPPLDVCSAGPKAAVEMLITALTREEGRNGIRANSVGVGQIEAGHSMTLMDDPRFVRLAERVVKATPLRRYGKAEEVADAVLFFASSMADFVSGENICVDGGGHV